MDYYRFDCRSRFTGPFCEKVDVRKHAFLRNLKKGSCNGYLHPYTFYAFRLWTAKNV